MSKIFSAIAAILLVGFWGASQARADVCGSVAGNLVQNCGFESGNFTGWTLGGNTSGGTPNTYGVDNLDPNSGTYEAYFGAAVSPISLSQTLNAAANQNYQLTFYLNQLSSDISGQYAHSFDVSFNGVVLDSVANAPFSNGYLKYSFTASTGATNSNILKFDFQNDDSFFELDDVSLAAVSSAVPEPASFLLVVPTLGGLIAVARRRRSVA